MFFLDTVGRIAVALMIILGVVERLKTTTSPECLKAWTKYRLAIAMIWILTAVWRLLGY